MPRALTQEVTFSAAPHMYGVSNFGAPQPEQPLVYQQSTTSEQAALLPPGVDVEIRKLSALSINKQLMVMKTMVIFVYRKHKTWMLWKSKLP